MFKISISSNNYFPKYFVGNNEYKQPNFNFNSNYEDENIYLKLWFLTSLKFSNIDEIEYYLLGINSCTTLDWQHEQKDHEFINQNIDMSADAFQITSSKFPIVIFVLKMLALFNEVLICKSILSPNVYVIGKNMRTKVKQIDLQMHYSFFEKNNIDIIEKVLRELSEYSDASYLYDMFASANGENIDAEKCYSKFKITAINIV